MKAFKLLLFSILTLILKEASSQSVVSGEITPGNYKSMQVDANGYLIPADYLAAIGFGETPNIRRVTGLGHNPDIDTGTTPEDIWEGGGLYPWLAVASSLEVVSTSTADAAAGTGARTVVVNCLNASYVELPQTVTLNGTTPVAVPLQCLRVNSALITSAGSGKVNAGDISVRVSGGGTVVALIPIGYGITRQSNYTVPAGYTLQVFSQYIAALRSSGAAANFDAATFMQSPSGFYRLPITITTGSNGVYRHDGDPGIIVQEKTDFILRVTSVTVNNTEVTGAWLGILRKNVQ